MGLRKIELRLTCRPCEIVSFWQRDGGLLLDPPYQRGDVWGPIRRRNLIRSMIYGIPIPSIIVNDRLGAEWKDDFRIAVIDGKQRLTTLLMFFADELLVPGELFGKDGDMLFSDLPIEKQRKFKNIGLPFSEGFLPTIEDEIEVFELVNFGGVPQGHVDQ